MIQNDGSIAGKLEFLDQGFGLKLKSSMITAVTSVGCTALIQGTGEANGGSVDFAVIVTDTNWPGASSDTFTINISGGVSYVAASTLRSGNIQVHGPLCT